MSNYLRTSFNVDKHQFASHSQEGLYYDKPYTTKMTSYQLNSNRHSNNSTIPLSGGVVNRLNSSSGSGSGTGSSSSQFTASLSSLGSPTGATAYRSSYTSESDDKADWSLPPKNSNSVFSRKMAEIQNGVNSSNSTYGNESNRGGGEHLSVSMNPLDKVDGHLPARPRHVKSSENFLSLKNPGWTLTEEISCSEQAGINVPSVEIGRDLRRAIKLLQSVPNLKHHEELSFNEDDMLDGPSSGGLLSTSTASATQETSTEWCSLSIGIVSDGQATSGSSVEHRKSNGVLDVSRISDLTGTRDSCGSDAVFYENNASRSPVRYWKNPASSSTPAGRTTVEHNAVTERTGTAESFEDILENFTETATLHSTIMTTERVVHSTKLETVGVMLNGERTGMTNHQTVESESMKLNHSHDDNTKRDYSLSFKLQKVQKQALPTTLVDLEADDQQVSMLTRLERHEFENDDDQQVSMLIQSARHEFENDDETDADVLSNRSESPDSLVERILDGIGVNDSIVVDNRVMRNSSMDRTRATTAAASTGPHDENGNLRREFSAIVSAPQSTPVQRRVTDSRMNSESVKIHETSVDRWHKMDGAVTPSLRLTNGSDVSCDSSIRKENLNSVAVDSSVVGSRSKQKSRGAQVVDKIGPPATHFEHEKSPEEIFEEIMESMKPDVLDDAEPEMSPYRPVVPASNRVQSSEHSTRRYECDVTDYSMENDLLSFYYGKATVGKAPVGAEFSLPEIVTRTDEAKQYPVVTLDSTSTSTSSRSVPNETTPKQNDRTAISSNDNLDKKIPLNVNVPLDILDLDLDNEFRANFDANASSDTDSGSLAFLVEQDDFELNESSTVKRAKNRDMSPRGVSPRDVSCLDHEVTVNQLAMTSTRQTGSPIKLKRTGSNTKSKKSEPFDESANKPSNLPVSEQSSRNISVTTEKGTKTSFHETNGLLETCIDKSTSHSKTVTSGSYDTERRHESKQTVKATSVTEQESLKTANGLETEILNTSSHSLQENDLDAVSNRDTSVNKVRSLKAHEAALEGLTAPAKTTVTKSTNENSQVLKAHPTIPGAIVLSEELTTQEVVLKIAWPKRRRFGAGIMRGTKSPGAGGIKGALKQPFRHLQLHRLIRMSQFDPDEAEDGDEDENGGEKSTQHQAIKYCPDSSGDDSITKIENANNRSTSLQSSDLPPNKTSPRGSPDGTVVLGSQHLAGGAPGEVSISDPRVHVEYIKQSTSNETESIDENSAVDVRRNECIKVLRIPANSVYRVPDLKQVVESVSRTMLEDSRRLPEDSDIRVTCEAVETKSRAAVEGRSNVTVIHRAILDRNSMSPPRTVSPPGESTTISGRTT